MFVSSTELNFSRDHKWFFNVIRASPELVFFTSPISICAIWKEKKKVKWSARLFLNSEENYVLLKTNVVKQKLQKERVK